jgi:hypothetical protein
MDKEIPVEWTIDDFVALNLNLGSQKTEVKE